MQNEKEPFRLKKKSNTIFVLVIAAAILVAPIIYVLANNYLPNILTQTFAQPNIEITTQSSIANVTVKEYWISSSNFVHRYELRGAYMFVTLSNTGDVNGYCNVAYYLIGIEQCVHTIFVRAHGYYFDNANVYYPTPIILTQSQYQSYLLHPNNNDAEAKIISQWKA